MKSECPFHVWITIIVCKPLAPLINDINFRQQQTFLIRQSNPQSDALSHRRPLQLQPFSALDRSADSGSS